VLWRFRRSSIIISSELHEKIHSTCTPVLEVDSEVLGLRTLPPDTLGEPDPQGFSEGDLCRNNHDAEEEDDLAFGYTRPWVCP
jgi:hypothetical protein